MKIESHRAKRSDGDWPSAGGGGGGGTSAALLDPERGELGSDPDTLDNNPDSRPYRDGNRQHRYSVWRHWRPLCHAKQPVRPSLLIVFFGSLLLLLFFCLLLLLNDASPASRLLENGRRLYQQQQQQTGFSSSSSTSAAHDDARVPPAVDFGSRDTSRLPIREDTTALCLVGEVRGMADERVSVQLSKLIDAWHAGRKTALSHAYLQLSMDEKNGYTVGELHTAFQRLCPFHVAFNIPDALLPEHPPQCAWRPLALEDPQARMTRVFWNTFRRLQLCYNTITQQEEKQGWRYAYLMRVRPDAEFHTALPFDLGSVNKTAISVFRTPPPFTSVADHFAVVPRALASIYFNAADTYLDCVPANISEAERQVWCTHPNTDVDPDFAPECYLARWLYQHRATVQPFTYPVETLVRGDRVSRYPHDFVR